MGQCNLYLTVLLISMFGWMLNVLLIYTAVSAALCKLECWKFIDHEEDEYGKI